MMPYIILGAFVIFLVLFSNIFNNKTNVLTYDEFELSLREGVIEELTIIPRDSAKVYEIKGRMKDYKENETFIVKAPLSETVMNIILQQKYNRFKDISKTRSRIRYTIYFINKCFTTYITCWYHLFFTRQIGGAAGNKSFDFGKAKLS